MKITDRMGELLAAPACSSAARPAGSRLRPTSTVITASRALETNKVPTSKRRVNGSSSKLLNPPGVSGELRA